MTRTFEVNGRKVNLSDEQIAQIVREYFATKGELIEEGKWYKVSPQNINKKLFTKMRNNENQEKLRQTILKTFSEMMTKPDKYGKDFELLIPQKVWDRKSAGELKMLAFHLGDGVADATELALLFAQLINNSDGDDKVWEKICNTPDTANYSMLIKYGNYVKIVGGKSKKTPFSMSGNIVDICLLDDVVPLVVRRQ